jgi:hypothetical protein
MPDLVKVKMVNPFGGKSAKNRGKGKKKKAKAAKRRATPKIMLLGGNPSERSTMSAKKKSKKKRPGKNYSKKKNGFFAKSKKNPMMGKKRSKPRGRNPILPIPGGEFGKGLVGVVGGGLGARLIPENVPFLSQYNNGFVGYGLNLLTTFLLAKVAKWGLGAKAEEGAYYGGILMTGSRFISDRFGKQIVTFGGVRLGNDPAFNLRKMGYYTSAASNPLSPLPVPTPYANSGPVPPLPVGTPPGQPAALPAMSAPATAAQAMTKPSTIAAASSMGWYGAKSGRYGVNRFM